MIDVKNLSVRYGKHQACSEVSLSVKPAEIVVILGANGAGKSTLLKAISGVCEGEVSGIVTLNGTGVVGKPPNEIVDMGLALVPENRGIFANLPVIENLRLGAYSKRARDKETANLALVHELFPKLDQRRNQIVRTMSGGEQQMVAIGRAMMSAPTILMLDEPSLGLSPLLSKDLFSRLKAIRAAGIGILLVEQNAKGSLAIADRGYVLENGRITRGASAAELREDPSVQQAYLGAVKGKGKGIGADRAAKISGLRQETAHSPASTTALPRPLRPGSPDPADIARAAMNQFTARQPVASQKPESPAQPQSQSAAGPRVWKTPSVSPSHPAATPSLAPSPVTQAEHPGPAAPVISDLVSKAEARLRANRRSPLQTSHRLPDVQSPQRAPSPSASVPAVPATSAAAPSDKNRLQQMMTDMEEAAHRAQAYRPSKRKDA